MMSGSRHGQIYLWNRERLFKGGDRTGYLSNFSGCSGRVGRKGTDRNSEHAGQETARQA